MATTTKAKIDRPAPQAETKEAAATKPVDGIAEEPAKQAIVPAAAAPTSAQLAEAEQAAIALRSLDMGKMPLGLRIYVDEAFFNHCSRIARQLSQARGFVPPHLIGNIASCFAVVEKALVWNLSPSAVAAATYETPGGKVGFEGKLCHAILEASRQFDGGIDYQLYGSVRLELKNGIKRLVRDNDPNLDKFMSEGAKVVEQFDWANVKGKFELARGQPKNGKPGKEYARATWGQKDAIGLGVTVSGKLKHEDKPRFLHFDLAEAWPRNSTLWATAPDRQIRYTAVRAFGNHVVPALLLGMPTEDDVDDIPFVSDANRLPRPRDTKAQMDAFAGETIDNAAADEKLYDIANADGELIGRLASATWFERFAAMAEGDDIGDAEMLDLWAANRQNAPKDNPDAVAAIEGMVGHAREAIQQGTSEGQSAADAHDATDEASGPATAASAPETDDFWQGDLRVATKDGMPAWVETMVFRAGEASIESGARLDTANAGGWDRYKRSFGDAELRAARARFAEALRRE